MTVLLDTQAFLWWIADDAKLTKAARNAIAANACLLSLASCWEMAMKSSLGKLETPRPLDRFIQEQLEINGFSLLPIALEHATGVAELPFHHRDLFDRLLAVQARLEELAVVSSDPAFNKYGVRRIW